ncbi:hypothetical protein SELMODRAFT_431083 [Selaginella moellendorffii]|uniref:Pectinesterase n=1 Tax=Selaginella moellendorffii TaxID=88036 RepID=D8TBF0_SELML|nr:hypothetical protein SELMODRAFT_431083 [Selaginella moellendorffii]
MTLPALLLLLIIVRFSCLDVIQGVPIYWVSLEANTSKLVYKPTNAGDTIMDFSAVGYLGRDAALPDNIPVKVALYPARNYKGSNKSHGESIQQAINEVSSLPLDPSTGYRGAIQLSSGVFDVRGHRFTINTSGIVITGSSSEETILQASVSRVDGDDSTFPHFYPLFSVESPQEKVSEIGSKTAIIATVPSGSRFVQLNSTRDINPGDLVRIVWPMSSAWIQTMNMTHRWSNASSTYIERKVASIDNASSRVFLDVPVSFRIDLAYLSTAQPAYLVKVNISGRTSHVGLENFKAVQDKVLPYGAGNFLNIQQVENSWVRNVAAVDFGGDTVTIAGTKVTVDNLHLERTIQSNRYGAKRADLAIQFPGSQILVKNSVIRGGDFQFSYITRNQANGPNVFFNSTGYGSSPAEPHSHFATGILYDNMNLVGGTLSLVNRATITHGYTSGFSVAWNCNATVLKVINPPQAANWAIGCNAKSLGSIGDETPGFIEPGGIESDRLTSLYLAQKKVAKMMNKQHKNVSRTPRLHAELAKPHKRQIIGSEQGQSLIWENQGSNANQDVKLFTRVFCAPTYWVSLDSDNGNKLVYKSTSTGDTIMDFSAVGYLGSDATLPDNVPVRRTLYPVRSGGSSKSDGDAIQQAIDEVSSLPLDPSTGFRGAIQLSSGVFDVRGHHFTINASGILITGSSSSETILHANVSIAEDGMHVYALFSVESPQQTISEVGHRAAIIETVPSGSRYVKLDSSSGLKPGDLVSIVWPMTSKWIQMMKMSERWGNYAETSIERRVIRVDAEKNTVFLDVPVPFRVDLEYLSSSQPAYLVKVEISGRVSQVGLENFKAVQDKVLPYGRGSFLSLAQVEDSWVRNVVAVDFGGDTMTVTGKRITVEGLNLIRTLPGPRHGPKPADLAIAFPGSQILVKNSIIEGGSTQFIYMTRDQANGPNVFFNSTGYGSAPAEPHAHFATGILYDNMKFESGTISLINRPYKDHGYTSGYSVVWNCHTKVLEVVKPPQAANWAIGGTTQSLGSIGDETPGFIEPRGIESHRLASLYLAQKAAAKIETSEQKYEK